MRVHSIEKLNDNKPITEKQRLRGQNSRKRLKRGTRITKRACMEACLIWKQKVDERERKCSENAVNKSGN